VVSPHPDDESLATGGLIARAASLGAAVRIAYLTSGDNNPWAQRATERRLFIRSADRERFAETRRGEVSAALGALGLGRDSVAFLGFPDQGLTRLLLAGDPELRTALAAEIKRWRPTLVTGPSMLDRHPDHNAAAALVELVVAGLPESARPFRRLRFLVHNPTHARPRPEDVRLPLEPHEQHAKRAAIACHRSQLFWRGEWLLGFAQAEERYLVEEPLADMAAHPIRRVDGRHGVVAFEIRSGRHLRAFGKRTLCLLAREHDQGFLCLAVPLPVRRGRTRVVDPGNGQACGEAVFSGTAGNGIVEVPRELLAGATLVLAKLEHRFGFFDEAGWKPLQVQSL
jgi:LmbE family N-acetylglucosaminyl deacetylase